MKMKKNRTVKLKNYISNKCFFKKVKLKFEKKFTSAEVIILIIITLIIGLLIGKLLNNTIIVSNNSIFNDKYINEFVTNYKYIIDNYYEDVDKEKLIESAIDGMTESLDDPYSVYYSEEESDNFQISLDGQYSGIGVQITKSLDNEYMKVTYVFENTPASEAGLKVGDFIVSINGKNSKDLTSEEFSNIVRGGTETKFNLVVIRDNEELNVVLEKEKVELKSVSSKIYTVNNEKVGYIYIGIFASNTYNQFKEELLKLESESICGLVIDVRSNSGGHLTAVNDILDLFLNSNQIMYQFNQNNKITKIYGTGSDNKNYEIVLLGNENSASASEVLISSLKENLGSKFVGKKTYGKGTVQEMVTLKSGAQYKITVKKWLTPKGNWINDTEGIMPDIEVELGEEYLLTGKDDDDKQLQGALNLFNDN